MITSSTQLTFSRAVDISNLKICMMHVQSVELLFRHRRVRAHQSANLSAWAIEIVGTAHSENDQSVATPSEKGRRYRRIGTSLIHFLQSTVAISSPLGGRGDSKTHGRILAPVTITSSCAQIDSLANSHAEPQIAAGREPQTMGLNLWSNVTL
jgi:hypothetical protein